LLCKPSRDVDSRKLRALLCKPSRDGVHANQGHFMQTGQIYTETRVQACVAQAWERKEKGTKREYGQRQGAPE
jgi:hypothetical protein